MTASQARRTPRAEAALTTLHGATHLNFEAVVGRDEVWADKEQNDIRGLELLGDSCINRLTRHDPAVVPRLNEAIALKSCQVRGKKTSRWVSDEREGQQEDYDPKTAGNNPRNEHSEKCRRNIAEEWIHGSEPIHSVRYAAPGKVGSAPWDAPIHPGPEPDNGSDLFLRGGCTVAHRESATLAE